MKHLKFFIILLIFIAFNLAVVSAGDVNDAQLNCSNSDTLNTDGPLQADVNNSVVKTTPVITIKSNKLNSDSTVEIHLKNSTGSPLKSTNMTAIINNKKYSLCTNSNGVASFKVHLPAKNYKLSVSFAGDANYKSVSKKFNIVVSKLNTRIMPSANFLIKGNYLYADLSDVNGNYLNSKKIIFKVNGKTYSKTTDKNGRAGIKISLSPSTYSVLIKFNGNGYYNSISKKFNLNVVRHTSITIWNTKLLSDGYLRIYLKGASVSDMSNKNLEIKIGNKIFKEKTNSEGIVVIKPQVNVKKYNIKVSYGKYWTSKWVNCVNGTVKDPLKVSIPLKNGVPDIDLMPGNYVMGDESATYTLTKAQYKEVIQRDSYCLYLNKKLSKYTFFKTKSHPKLNHIIKRTKWNVIERAINAKVVNANKYNYWPSQITVSLKGKSYVYSEVRDVQNTGYTCGPASASVCSQVLRNYMSEKYLASVGKSKPGEGTPCARIIDALGKDYNCTYFYEDTFDWALNELSQGGCAIIFHTKFHYVAILDISKDGKYVLVSNSYHSYYNIPSKWLSVKYMKTRFIEGKDDCLLVKLNYSLSDSTINSINNFYSSMGKNWVRKNTNQLMG
ncbi:MAG: hypothetical protein IJF83_09945 [Methanobrevibacter sp.]|nr:hypothetical protein [Methanobrevibacter sp.]